MTDQNAAAARAARLADLQAQHMQAIADAQEPHRLWSAALMSGDPNEPALHAVYAAAAAKIQSTADAWAQEASRRT